MQTLVLAIVLVGLTIVGFRLGRGRAVAGAAAKGERLHSLPGYYGSYIALWCGLPAFLLLGFWLALESTVIEGLVVSALPQALQELPDNRLKLIVNDIRNLATGNIVATEPDATIRAAAAHYSDLRSTSFWLMAVLSMLVALALMLLGMRRLAPHLRARQSVERVVMIALMVSSTIAIFTTIGIVLSLLFEAFRFFQQVSIFEFMFGLEWSPQIAIRKDQVGSSAAFGAIPLFAGTMLISFIAMLVAVPIGLFAAIYMAEYAPPKWRNTIKPVLEILAGIPTVVYGFFAALTMAPFFRNLGEALGLELALATYIESHRGEAMRTRISSALLRQRADDGTIDRKNLTKFLGNAADGRMARMATGSTSRYRPCRSACTRTIAQLSRRRSSVILTVATRSTWSAV